MYWGLPGHRTDRKCMACVGETRHIANTVNIIPGGSRTKFSALIRSAMLDVIAIAQLPLLNLCCSFQTLFSNFLHAWCVRGIRMRRPHLPLVQEVCAREFE